MKGKFIKKLTAYAMVAAMVVSTPVTASAAEFSDNFWMSDGTTESNPENNPDNEPTGTVSRTGTGTDSTVLKENEASIIGLAITPTSVVTEVGKEVELKAQVLTDGEIAQEKLDEITRRIRWKSSDMWTVSVDAKTVNGMDKCTIKGKKGGFATVTAGLDMDNDGELDYKASVKVMVKHQATSIAWKQDKITVYQKHTLNLKDQIKVEPVDATVDDIVFTVKGSSKTATVSEDGVLTAKGLGTVTVTATTNYGVTSKDLTVTIEEGNPVKSIKITGDKEVDFGKDKKYNATPTGTLTATIANMKSGENTDEIIWTSSDENIVTVKADSEDITKAITAKFTGVSVGKAKITATATSGKKATFNVTVKATLISIDEVIVDDSWSGKTEVVTVKRTPAQNVDKLKITTNNKLVKAKNYTITSAADLKAESIQVKVTATDSKTKMSATSDAVTVKQSNVKLNDVTNKKTNKSVKTVKTQKANIGNNLTYNADVTATTPNDLNEALDVVSWVSSKESVATVENGKVKVVGVGSAKITASSVYLDGSKYKVSKIQFTVKATPACEEIVLKSNTAAAEAGKKITINVKQQLPKKAADDITWYVNGVKQTDKKIASSKKLTYTIPTSASVGDTIAVLAVARNDMKVTAIAQATIYVVKTPATKVNATIDGTEYKKITLNVGAQKKVNANVIGKNNAKSDEPIVGYAIDKNGVSVVKIDTEGNLTCIGQGKATVSVLSASGKSGKVTITVE